MSVEQLGECGSRLVAHTGFANCSGGLAIEPSPSPSHWAKSYADKDRSICFQKCRPHNARHGGRGAAQATLPTLPETLRASPSGGILDGFLNGICAFPPKTGVDVKRLCGFCASSSAKAVMDWLGYAAWRRLVFLCSLRSFMLR